MPRAVSALLWQTSRRAASCSPTSTWPPTARTTGCSHVPPSYGPDGGIVGHHSNRRRPSPGAIRTVVPLYEQLLAEERGHPTAEAAVTGLSQLAERLRSEATGFLAAMRR